jgi:hypothetical protein
MVPITVITVSILCRRRGNTLYDARDLDRFVLIACVAAWCSLVQFPFSAPIYFSFVAPLVLFAGAALWSLQGAPSSAGATILGAYAAFALAVRPQLFPRRPELSSDASRLELPRGGIYVLPAEAHQYADLVRLVLAHSRSASLLALPDVPEVYYLSGLRNPTRAIYDIFADTAARDTRLLGKLKSEQITAVVINHAPPVSPPVSQALGDSLARQYPYSRHFGALEVRWKQ